MVPTQKAKACVAIPVYKNSFDDNERFVLKQAFAIFANLPIVFFHPENLDLAPLKGMFAGFANADYRGFDERHFKNVQTYSRLLLDQSFYERFSDFEFMLIYQTDAFVFSNQLHEWCTRGLDYIGAPWFKDFEPTSTHELLPFAGNGGFSLRNVTKINALMKRRIPCWEMPRLFWILRNAHITPQRPSHFYCRLLGLSLSRNNSLAQLRAFIWQNAVIPHEEDYFFALILPKIFPEFKVASALEAVPFAFECQPETLFKLNGEKLPFGCHAWQKHSPQFWQKYLRGSALPIDKVARP